MNVDKEYEEGQVTVGGVTVTYRVAGPRNGRAPLVLVHGTAGSVDRHFGYIFPMMAFRQRVIAFDMVDPGTETLELDQIVAQVKAVIDAEVPDVSITLLGYSLGSVVAAKVAAELGDDKVSKLMLVAGWVKTDTHMKMRNRLWSRICEHDPNITAEFMTMCAFSSHFMSTRTVEELTAGSAKVEITPFMKKQMELNTRIDITEEVDKVKCKTLIVACSDDFMIHRRNSKMLFGAIENSTYTEIASGHGVVVERPAEIFSHIDRFCKRPELYPIGEIVKPHKP